MKIIALKTRLINGASSEALTPSDARATGSLTFGWRVQGTGYEGKGYGGKQVDDLWVKGEDEG